MSVDPLDQMQKLRADAARSAAASKHPEANRRGFALGASLLCGLIALPVPGAVADVFTERAKLRQVVGADAALLARAHQRHRATEHPCPPSDCPVYLRLLREELALHLVRDELVAGASPTSETP